MVRATPHNLKHNHAERRCLLDDIVIRGVGDAIRAVKRQGWGWRKRPLKRWKSKANRGNETHFTGEEVFLSSAEEVKAIQKGSK